MSFNIGSQTGGVINNVMGDQHVADGQHGHAVSHQQAWEAVRALRGHLADSGLDRTTALQATATLRDVDTEMHAAIPDRSRIARSVQRFTELLAGAGRLVAAGGALLRPLSTLATWLGSYGDPIRHLLPAFG